MRLIPDQYYQYSTMILIQITTTYSCSIILTHWHLELFAKIFFFSTFWWCWSWIVAKLASVWWKNALVTRQLAVLATRITFKTFWPRHAQKSKFWEFLDEKVTYGIRLFDCWILFPFPFYSRFFFAAVIGLLPGLKKISGRVIEVANFYHGAARCSGRKFGSKFFAQLFEHFCAYLRFQ